MKNILSLLIAVVLAGVIMAPHAAFSAVDKILWCHVEPNGNSQTLELPAAALQNAGHMDASGNPLHAGDHAGACEQPTVTPTPTMSPTPTATPMVTPTPTPTEETTPTPTPPQNIGGPGDGLSDGRSDGKSSCPECTKAPTGQVLGASTDMGYAATGSAEGILMNVVGSMGAMLTVAGAFLKKRNIA